MVCTYIFDNSANNKIIAATVDNLVRAFPYNLAIRLHQTIVYIKYIYRSSGSTCL